MHLSTVHRSTDNRIYYKECYALSEAGFDVTYVSHGTAPVGRVPWKQIPSQKTGRVRRLLASQYHAWRILTKHRPQLLHIHDPELIPFGILWRTLHRGCRIVFDVHEDLPNQIVSKNYIPTRAKPMARSLARSLFRLADRCYDGIVLAEPIHSSLFRRAPSAMVQNFPWRRDFDAVRAKPRTTHRRLVYIGGLSIERGVSDMVEALKHIPEPVELVLAGPADHEARKILDRSPSNVTYLGVVQPSAVPEILASSAVGLVVLHDVPNYTTAQPTKLLEYIAAGLPFVASDFPAWRTLAGNNYGVWVTPKDPKALAAAATAVLARLVDTEEPFDPVLRGTFLEFETQALILSEFTESILQ